jgi:hypothetical protein
MHQPVEGRFMTWPAPEADDVTADEPRRRWPWRPTWLRAPDIEAEAMLRLTGVCAVVFSWVVIFAAAVKILIG